MSVISRTKTLTARVVIISLLAIAIISILLWCPAIVQFQKRESERYRSFAEGQADLIKRGLQYSMLRNERDHIQEMINSVAGVEGTLWVRITDRNDIIRFSSRREEIGKRCPEECKGLDEGTENNGLIKEINGNKVLLISGQVENMKSCYTGACHFHKEDEKNLGRIELAFDFNGIHKEVKSLGMTVASFGIIFTTALSMVVLFFLLRTMILKRLTLLAEASKKVASGDLDIILPTAGEAIDEIGYLTETFNKMVRELREKRDVMQREVNGYKESLIQAQKMESIGLLSAGIAHDFNNILTGIIGLTELSFLKVDDPEIRENLKKVIETAERGSDLTKQILLIGRKLPPQMKPLNINIFINDSYKMLRRLVEENIELRTILKDDLPFIQADPSQLMQVLMNLVVNARDAIEGSGTITIGTDEVMIDENYCRDHPEARPGHYVVLSVRDTGTGIPEELRDRVFDPFFTTKEKGKGTGLGLAVTYAIVKTHNGWIGLYSEPGKGTEFRVYLPGLERQGAEEGETEMITVSKPEERVSTILLVDDEEMIRDVGTTIIKDLGHEVITATNGREAVNIYRERGKEIDLVIMDLVMPVMDGMTAFREIRKIDPDAKVIISSGYSADREEILKEEGVTGFINKPYRLKDIMEIISRNIRQP